MKISHRDAFLGGEEKESNNRSDKKNEKDEENEVIGKILCLRKFVQSMKDMKEDFLKIFFLISEEENRPDSYLSIYLCNICFV